MAQDLSSLSLTTGLTTTRYLAEHGAKPVCSSLHLCPPHGQGSPGPRGVQTHFSWPRRQPPASGGISAQRGQHSSASDSSALSTRPMPTHLLTPRSAASKATDRCSQPGSVLGLDSLHSVCLLQNRKYRNQKCTPQICIFRLVVISAKNLGVIMGLTFYKGAQIKYFLRN